MASYELGVMQGRLLPKYLGRYQAHPVGYWQDEFPVAAKLGLDLIEFILDYNDYEKNPLTSDLGVEQLARVINDTGVRVKTVCADYFMEAPFHSEDTSQAKKSLQVLSELIARGKSLGLTDIVIPCVDQSSLRGAPACDRFVTALRSVIPEAEAAGINLALETDLPPGSFVELLERCSSPRVTVNYDIGNSASLGYLPREELAAYGHAISDIHIKDRKLGAGSVVLGNGNADFDEFFRAWGKIGKKVPFIMQAFRDDEGLEVFKRQLSWVRPRLEALR